MKLVLLFIFTLASFKTMAFEWECTIDEDSQRTEAQIVRISTEKNQMAEVIFISTPHGNDEALRPLISEMMLSSFNVPIEKCETFISNDESTYSFSFYCLNSVGGYLEFYKDQKKAFYFDEHRESRIQGKLLLLSQCRQI